MRAGFFLASSCDAAARGERQRQGCQERLLESNRRSLLHLPRALQAAPAAAQAAGTRLAVAHAAGLRGGSARGVAKARPKERRCGGAKRVSPRSKRRQPAAHAARAQPRRTSSAAVIVVSESTPRSAKRRIAAALRRRAMVSLPRAAGAELRRAAARRSVSGCGARNGVAVRATRRGRAQKSPREPGPLESCAPGWQNGWMSVTRRDAGAEAPDEWGAAAAARACGAHMPVSISTTSIAGPGAGAGPGPAPRM